MLWRLERRPMFTPGANVIFFRPSTRPEPKPISSAHDFAESTSMMAEGGSTWLLERYEWMFDTAPAS